MLEFNLGVKDVTHRRELLSTIRSLYPQSTARVDDSFYSLPQPLNTTETRTFESTCGVLNCGSPSRTRGMSGIELR